MPGLSRHTLKPLSYPGLLRAGALVAQRRVVAEGSTSLNVPATGEVIAEVARRDEGWIDAAVNAGMELKYVCFGNLAGQTTGE